MTVATTPTPVQLAVLQVVVARGDLGTANDDWWRCEAPFRGERAAFAAHLRKLDTLGYVHRHEWTPIGLSEQRIITYRPGTRAIEAVKAHA